MQSAVALTRFTDNLLEINLSIGIVTTSLTQFLLTTN